MGCDEVPPTGLHWLLHLYLPAFLGQPSSILVCVSVHPLAGKT